MADPNDNATVQIAPHGTPGILGAIHDAVQAIAGAVAPKAITGRKRTVDDAVDEASGETPKPKGLGDEI